MGKPPQVQIFRNFLFCKFDRFDGALTSGVQMRNAVSPVVAGALGRCLAKAAAAVSPAGAAVISVPDPVAESVSSFHASYATRQCAPQTGRRAGHLLLDSVSSSTHNARLCQPKYKSHTRPQVASTWDVHCIPVPRPPAAAPLALCSSELCRGRMTHLGCFWLQNYARARAAGLKFYIEREPGGEAGLCARQANRRQQEVRRGLDVEVRRSLPKFRGLSSV
jgi:hypothetical protein